MCEKPLCYTLKEALDLKALMKKAQEHPMKPHFLDYKTPRNLHEKRTEAAFARF